jgi:hypothetical protein
LLLFVGATVTTAEADWEESACAVAVTFTVAGFGTVDGAVYKPAEVTVPQVEPVQPDPATVQVTPKFELPVTVAWNCCWAPTINKALVGEIVTDTGMPILTCAEAYLVVSACDVAVTLTSAGLGMITGAVYRPAAVTFPQFEPAQPVPETLHDTDVFELPVTCAENCREAEGASFAELGEILTVTSATTVTVALADLVGSATDVAVREKKGGLGGAEGAVNNPEELTVPHTVPAQPVPAIVQVTAVLDEPVTLALNCFCALTPTWAVVGEIEIPTAPPELMVTVADADLVGSDNKVAVTATIGGLGALAGAVYRPLALIAPQEEPLHPLPDTLQITTALEFPFTEALNCSCAPGFSWAEGGDTLTETPATNDTAAEAEAEGSAWAVAFTLTLGGVGRAAGAV